MPEPKEVKQGIMVYKGRGKSPWRWKVIAKNGETVGTSHQGFPTKKEAIKDAKLLVETLINSTFIV